MVVDRCFAALCFGLLRKRLQMAHIKCRHSSTALSLCMVVSSNVPNLSTLPHAALALERFRN